MRVFGFHLRSQLVALAGAEALLFFVAPFVAVHLRFHGTFLDIKEKLPSLWPQGLLFAAVMMISLLAMGLYSSRQRASIQGVLVRTVASGVAAFIVLGLLYYMLPSMFLGRGLLLLMVIVGVLGSAAGRLVARRVIDDRIFKRRVLVYGVGDQAFHISRLRRRSDQRGFVVVGYVPGSCDSVTVPEEQIIKSTGTLFDICRECRVEEIVVAMDDRRRSFPVQELLECRLRDIDVIDVLSFLERETGKVRVEVLTPSWMIFGSGFSRSGPRQFTARALDVLASLALLAISWPVMLLTALAIKIEDGVRAPVFYSQTRVGLEGRTFQLLKFRSMRVDAEKEGKAIWAEKQDRRVTRVGSATRAIRLDELPQIFNVLAGDMRFVGPRPERPEFVESLCAKIPYYRERHIVKPGITGWAQLCYPYGSSEQDAIEKLQYDLYYVKNHSLIFDLSILAQTIEVILWRKGAR